MYALHTLNFTNKLKCAKAKYVSKCASRKVLQEESLAARVRWYLTTLCNYNALRQGAFLVRLTLFLGLTECVSESFSP